MKMQCRHKGFTLIELLIVIVVIGILSAMMIFSSTEAMSSAKASNIIGNMRQLKTATLEWYTDNLGRITRDPDFNPNNVNKQNKYKIDGKFLSNFIKDNNGKGGKEILKYISNGSSITLSDNKKKEDQIKEGEYIIAGMAGSSKWYVCYYLGKSDSRLKEKLAGRQKTAGLLGIDSFLSNKIGTSSNITNFPIDDPYTNQKFVCMLILDLGD